MFPVGDFIRTRSVPYVNWFLIGTNVAIFVFMLTLDTRPDEIMAGLITSETDRFYFDWGYVPACIADYVGLGTDASPRALFVVCPDANRELVQPFTSMFLHGGWAHIFGNMLFLWIFGDNVEDRIGHLRYLLFYVLAGLIASGVQIYMATDTVVPAVGASGAIAGVLGAYLTFYPKAIVQVVILPLFFIPFYVPAVLLIGVWFFMQLFAGLAEIAQHTTTGSGVAWWAHIGGFIAGAVLIWLFRKRARRPAFTQSANDL